MYKSSTSEATIRIANHTGRLSGPCHHSGEQQLVCVRDDEWPIQCPACQISKLQ
jgi:hypothetical protein